MVFTKPSASPFVVNSAGVCYAPGHIGPGMRVHGVVTYKEIRGDLLPWSPDFWHPAPFFVICGNVKDVKLIAPGAPRVYTLTDFTVSFTEQALFTERNSAIKALQTTFTRMTRGAIKVTHVPVYTVEEYNTHLHAAHARVIHESTVKVAS